MNAPVDDPAKRGPSVRYRRRPVGLLIALCCVMVVSCGPRTAPYRTAAQPHDAMFGSGVPAGHTRYDNASLADVFVLLTHGLENGESRKSLQRFEAPIRIGMVGPGAEEYVDFLDRFVTEIRTEAGVPISTGPGPWNLLIRFVPGEEFLPLSSNQCLVIFGQPDWETLNENPSAYGGRATSTIDLQTEMSVIIPDTIEPFKVRECLLEEVTQALGPANDLYGLGPTIFNDDNAHSWPTKLDYLMLQVLYSPEMRSGMSKTESLRTALSILNRINPEGRDAPPLPPIEQARFRDWRRALLAHEDLEDPDIALAEARRIARQARRMAPGTAYDCTGITFLSAVARSVEANDTEMLLQDAIRTCTAVHGPDDVRIALIRLRLSYVLLDRGDYAQARDVLDAILPALKAHALDGSVAAAYIARTAAAMKMHDPNWDGPLLAKAAAWAAFAYGADHDLTSKLRPF